MDMNTTRKMIIALVPALVMLGCGGNGASNNDQGISVSFLGLFQSTTSQNSSGSGQQNNLTGCGQLPQPLAAGYVSVGQTFVDPTATPQPGLQGLSIDPSGAVYAIVGIQNNMFGQVYRADRVLLQYYIPGSSIQPPSTNVAVNLLAGPAESGMGGSGSSSSAGGLRRPHVTSLPPTFNQVCNRAFASVPIIPAPVREWMSFNVNQLPEPPYDLEVVVSLTGLSSGGNRYDTNEGLFTISVIPEIQVIPPTPSSTTSTDTGTADATSDTSNATDTSTLSVREGADEAEAQGLDELESAFETESVVAGE